VVLIQFWIWIRILLEKLYMLVGSNPFIIDFRKLFFEKFSVCLVFLFLKGISRSRSTKIERSMKKYPRGLILRFFGQVGDPKSPPAAPGAPRQEFPPTPQLSRA